MFATRASTNQHFLTERLSRSSDTKKKCDKYCIYLLRQQARMTILHINRLYSHASFLFMAHY